MLAAAPLIFYLAIPISSNSLDREGARLLSPRGSQITITPDAGPDDSAPETRMSSSGSSTKTHNVTMFPFPMISSDAQLGVIETVSHVGLSFILAP